LRHEPILKVLDQHYGNVSIDERWERLKRDLPTLSQSLNLSPTINEDKRSIMFQSRVDPIGLDVDLFFRCCKFALPGIVSIGQHLFCEIFKNTAGTECSVAIAHDTHTTFRHYNFIEKQVSSKELKGIDKDYSIYRLLTYCYEPQLAFSGTDKNVDGCQATREMLLDAGFIQVIDQSVRYKICSDHWTKFGKP